MITTALRPPAVPWLRQRGWSPAAPESESERRLHTAIAIQGFQGFISPLTGQAGRHGSCAVSTVGAYYSWGTPELVVVGLPPQFALLLIAQIIGFLGGILDWDAIFARGMVLTTRESIRVRWVDLHPSQRDHLVSPCHGFYDGRTAPFPWVQLEISDSDGRYAGDPGFDATGLHQQVSLGVPWVDDLDDVGSRAPSTRLTNEPAGSATGFHRAVAVRRPRPFIGLVGDKHHGLPFRS